MSISGFNATLWAKSIQSNLNKKHVFAARFNRKYEGLAKQGGTVKINSIGRITVKDYTRNAGAGGTAAAPTIAGIDRPEILIGSAMYLDIDKAKYFNFEVDDIDKAQQNPTVMGEATREAAYSLANAADLIAGAILQDGVAGTVSGTGNRLDARTIGTGDGDDDAYEALVDLKVKLIENDVDVDMMWAIIPPWFEGMLQKDPRFTNYGTEANRRTLVNGSIGRAAGLELYVSNNISGPTAGTLAVAGGVYTIIAGTNDAATWAEQLDKVEAFRPQDGFNDALKGLHVYGGKVTRPYALASVAATPA
jgi:hypothetical protein